MPLAASLHGPGPPGESTTLSPGIPIACSTSTYCAMSFLLLAARQRRDRERCQRRLSRNLFEHVLIGQIAACFCKRHDARAQLLKPEPRKMTSKSLAHYIAWAAAVASTDFVQHAL